MMRPLLAIPFLAVALVLGHIAEAFANVAALIDGKPCAGCGGSHADR